MSSAQDQSSAGWYGCLYILGNLALIVGFFVALSKPWYSWEEYQHLMNLRQACRGKSIQQFLKENPQWKNDPTFAHLPVEHWILDKMMWYVVVGAVIWNAPVILAKAPASTAKQPAPQPSVAAEPMPESTPASYKISCTYCGGTIVTELSPGQPINCPHCGAALKAPNAS